MSELDRQLSEQFYRWEGRGRGWQVFPDPVRPEPPFRPFSGHFLPSQPHIDDGARPTFLSSLVSKLSQKLSTAPQQQAEPAPIEEEEPEPSPLERNSQVELRISLPDKLDVSKEAFSQFLTTISLCREPIAFELLGQHRKITAQFAVGAEDAPLFRRQLEAFFPEAMFLPCDNVLESAWDNTSGNEMLAVEFGLKNEFMLPLGSVRFDPYVGIIGGLAELQPHELGLYQVIFQPTGHPWSENIIKSVTHFDGKPFFVNSPELAEAARAKVKSPIYAAVVRILLRSRQFDRLIQLGRDLAGALRVYAHPDGNELIPLHNEDYPFQEHVEDVLCRQSRRTGMLLNGEELAGFVHLPSSSVRCPVFERQSLKTKAAPAIVRQSGLLLGHNEHAGNNVEVRLTADQRTHHTHIIGASGSGKSTLLFNLIRADIENGEGVAVFDPHGDLVDRICRVIPENRIGDVIVIDPTDETHAVGFNLLSAHSSVEKELLASDLVSVFERLSTSWGDQMNSVLQNAILAFLESERGGTIADLRRFLVEPGFRNDFLKTVTDSEVVYYWQKSFPFLSGNKSIGSILTRLDMLLAKKPIRHMVCQRQNRLDFAGIMDRGEILLAKLPEGSMGRENSCILGTLLVSKFQQIAMSRQAQAIESRRDFWLYIDEVGNFLTPTMATILSGARKYRIGLTLAHHELHQLARCPEVASAVETHPYTRIIFRVGDEDSRKLAENLSFFEARDLRNQKAGEAIVRVESDDFDFNLTVPLPQMPDQASAQKRQEEVITASRKAHGTPRVEIEAMLSRTRESNPPPEPPSQEPPPTPPAPPPVQPKTPVPTGESPVPVVESKAEAPAKEPVRDLGRGGAQHQAIQKRIKEEAESSGFRSIIEKSILDGQGSVDLWLERGDYIVACEISVTTTVDHEFGNVAKCLKAGVPRVAVVSVDEDRLRKIGAAVSGSLGAEMSARVEYFQPDAFIAHLKSLPRTPESTPKNCETVRRGYKVKRILPNLSPDEQKQRDGIINQVMMDTMKRKKGK